MPSALSGQHSVTRERLVWATPAAVTATLLRIGREGYFADRWLWAMRSLLAPVLVSGGSRGAGSGPIREVGESVDFWRVDRLEPERAVAVACTMRGLGEARLEWTIEPRPAGRCLVTQTARLAPRGAIGAAYWSASLPVHLAIFGRLLRGVAMEAERKASTPPPAQRPTRGLRIIRRAITVRRDLDEAFAFFADAGNLEGITPPWLNFRITTPTPIAMHEGTLIDYRIRLHGIPVRWHTRIDAWEPCTRFVDRQLKGPYRWWHHEHRFEPVEGGTNVIDEVEYAAPLRWLSEPLVVRRDVERIFDFRSERLRDLLG